ncbi:MAG: hypothetical protein MKZ58_04280 [Candidatus Poseidoniaceae archaeon]|nr:hypothetical protein [Candidatus Poseidoniaceae archaeon]|tara:strand:+ start:1714 stop:2199 length:486 start_codon:yes stop_codon:yes gene_type:complete
MTEPSRVFVPSVTEENGNTIGLGVFSSEEVAWKVLRTFLKKSHLMSLTRSDLVIWEIDQVGEEAMTILSSMHCRDCPVCKRRTFWIDLDSYSAMCTGTSCEAWIEESTVEPGKIDLGWPPTRFLKQTESLEDALTELRVLGAEVEAAGRTPEDPITSIPEE